jgi:uncharacterized protein (UPF0332 family)
MSFDWEQYLYLAQELAGKEPDVYCNEEAELRAAISRAYYAAFRLSRNFLVAKGEYDLKYGYGSHIDVINLFENSKIPERRPLGIHLRRMKIIRESADYDDIFRRGSLQEQANYLLERAKTIIERLQTIP